jgi:hypothetical protein
MVGTMHTDQNRSMRELPAPVQVAGFVSLAWSPVLIARAAYNCFVQVGFVTFVRGIVYDGTTDGTGNADTGSLVYGLLYPLMGLAVPCGAAWAGDALVGVALTSGYDRRPPHVCAASRSTGRPRRECAVPGRRGSWLTNMFRTTPWKSLVFAKGMQ